MKPSRMTPLLRTLAAASALGLTLSAQAALAQSDKTDNDVRPAAIQAGPPKDSTVGGVVVQAPREPEQPVIPADKKAAFDNEAAKAETWRRYRQATPPLSEGTLGQAKGYPGLQSLLPNPEDPGETH
jgi:hypothetical protein